MAGWVSTVSSRAANFRWRVAWDVARWLWKKGREALDETLSQEEQSELWELMRKSKGRRGNLSKKEQSRFYELVRKAAKGVPAALMPG